MEPTPTPTPTKQIKEAAALLSDLKTTVKRAPNSLNSEEREQLRGQVASYENTCRTLFHMGVVNQLIRKNEEERQRLFARRAAIMAAIGNIDADEMLKVVQSLVENKAMHTLTFENRSQQVVNVNTVPTAVSVFIITNTALLPNLVCYDFVTNQLMIYTTDVMIKCDPSTKFDLERIKCDVIPLIRNLITAAQGIAYTPSVSCMFSTVGINPPCIITTAGELAFLTSTSDQFGAPCLYTAMNQMTAGEQPKFVFPADVSTNARASKFALEYFKYTRDFKYVYLVYRNCSTSRYGICVWNMRNGGRIIARYHNIPSLPEISVCSNVEFVFSESQGFVPYLYVFNDCEKHLRVLLFDPSGIKMRNVSTITGDMIQTNRPFDVNCVDIVAHSSLMMLMLILNVSIDSVVSSRIISYTLAPL